MRSSNNIFLLDQVQDGIVFKFRGGVNLPSTNITDQCPVGDVTPCPDRHAFSIFMNGEKQSRFGFDFEFLRSESLNLTQVAVSSIHSAFIDSARLSGKINIF